VRARYWNAGRQLFADTPSGTRYSQHTNVLAVLAGVTSGAEARALVERVVDDRTLVPCSYYFRHYLHAALQMAGAGDRYLDMLGEWESMLSRGLTTWAERPDRPGNPSRSDCHAWSSSPNFELFRTVLGIDTGGAGFSRVRIQPFLGRLEHAAGSIPHPRGLVSVALDREGPRLRVRVELPSGVTGTFVWGGVSRNLAGGTNQFTVEP
jgi:hypothetical protein